MIAFFIYLYKNNYYTSIVFFDEDLLKTCVNNHIIVKVGTISKPGIASSTKETAAAILHGWWIRTRTPCAAHQLVSTAGGSTNCCPPRPCVRNA